MPALFLIQAAYAGGSVTDVWPGQALGIALIAVFVFVGIPVMLLSMRKGPPSDDN